MPNRLADASSPYLLQHADNPVHWYEWGEDAFAAARLLDRPILLSVGYATCHWCHVMAHESFEDPGTAAYMNDHFVSIKVDREERPDIDRIYMDAVQATTGRGGWPMTVFLAPDGEPFFAGTYFPFEARGGYPSFRQVMESVTEAWANRRGELAEQAGRLAGAVRAEIPPADTGRDLELVETAVEALADGFDWEHGGFGGAPKFPQAADLELLLRVLALDLLPERTPQAQAMLRTTLDAMAAGGIHDQLAGGFSRYSVDRRWLVPHFEKMLYDNALLARLYLRAWQETGAATYRRVAVRTLDYMLTDLADPTGGLYSGEDADSEGEEGKFYVWSWDELADTVGDDLGLVAAAYGASPPGNFEGGTNILTRSQPVDVIAERFGASPAEIEERLERCRRVLLKRRATRVRPSVDDKIVTAWNGLALRALAEAGAVLDDPRYRTAAKTLADFAVSNLTLRDGRLVRTWRQGVVGPLGFCDDYGAMAVGLFTLYQASGETRWFAEAERLTRAAIALFADAEGGFFATGADAERLISRPKNLIDNPTPSDNTLIAEALQILTAYTGDSTLRAHLDGIYRAAGTLLERHPGAVSHLVAIAASGLNGPKEVAVVGASEARGRLTDVVWERYRPDCVLATAESSLPDIPLLEDRVAPTGSAAAYVCRDFVCDLPVSEPEALRQLLVGK